MADFALWARASETSLCPPARSRGPTRPIAESRLRMPSTPIRWPPVCASLCSSAAPGRAAPSTCCGSAPIAAVTLLLAVVGARGWPKNPRALAGRLRRAQTFLRIMGIEVAFTREGRTRARSGRPPSRPQTILTVLTQTQAFVWANGGQG
jgi:hypothetical protein